jgi:erythrin-vacuolar iron transport family protein
MHLKRFADLSEQEILAPAISNEEDDNRIYRALADRLRRDYPDTAAIQSPARVHKITLPL